jgi:hypothetical protein
MREAGSGGAGIFIFRDLIFPSRFSLDGSSPPLIHLLSKLGLT